MSEDPQGTPPGADEGAWELPWAEPFAAGSGRPERAQLAAAFGAAIRRTGSLMQHMGQAAADRIGINATDLNCLNILSFSGQMTAGQLAKATGLTTASITGVIARLVLERAVSDVASVFLPMVRAWQEMAERYSDDELRLIVEFYGQMEDVLRQHIAVLRDSAPPA